MFALLMPIVRLPIPLAVSVGWDGVCASVQMLQTESVTINNATSSFFIMIDLKFEISY